MRFKIGPDSENYTEGITVISPITGGYDAALNDSDKSYTVPNGETWKLIYAFVTLTTTAGAGNRQMRFSVTDASGNEVGYISAGAVQSPGSTNSYGFMQGIYRETSFVDNMIQVPIPIDLYLPAGYSMRFYDSNAVAPAADDMIVSYSVERFKGV